MSPHVSDHGPKPLPSNSWRDDAALWGLTPAECSAWLGRLSAHHAKLATTLRLKAARGYRVAFKLGVVSVVCAFMSVGLRILGWLLA